MGQKAATSPSRSPIRATAVSRRASSSEPRVAGGAAPTITFDPARIANRHVPVITPGQPSAGDAAALKAHRTGSGNAGVGATSGGGNHVVRMYSGGGKIR